MGQKSSKLYVGMDVHKESIDIALAEPTGEVRRWGQIGAGSGRRSRSVAVDCAVRHPQETYRS